MPKVSRERVELRREQETMSTSGDDSAIADHDHDHDHDHVTLVDERSMVTPPGALGASVAPRRGC